MNKHQRYRRKCLSEGRCPHCGEPCAPYAECENRRFKKSLYRAMRLAIATGAVVKLDKGPGKPAAWKISHPDAPWPTAKASGRKGDKRILPKFGDKPFHPDNLIRFYAKSIAMQHGGFVTEAQIEAAIGSLRLKHSRRAKL